MTHVVTESCIRCRYTDCVDVCPGDCFRVGGDGFLTCLLVLQVSALQVLQLLGRVLPFLGFGQRGLGLGDGKTI